MAIDPISPTAIEVGRVFTPASPVNVSDLFAGRKEQLRRVVDAINQSGQHAVVFGERGVGKTSLANILSSALVRPGQSFYAPRVNCDSEDTFGTVWIKVFNRIAQMLEETGTFGQDENGEEGYDHDDDDVVLDRIYGLMDTIDDSITPGLIVHHLSRLSRSAGIVPILDEFDRLQRSDTRRAIADTIKGLSDSTTDSTLIVVGVADSVDDLIAGHESIERNLVQIQMPRMSPAELEEILDKGTSRLGMTIEKSAKSRIATLSRGLPHYTHLLGGHASRDAIKDQRSNITEEDVRDAIHLSIDDVQQSIRNAYHKAVYSAHSDAIYKQVLAACAMAEASELGWFPASAVREPLSKFMGKPYDIPNYARHLGVFCDEERGCILQKTGKPNRYRFRFSNPLMQPYAVLKGMADGYVKADDPA
jgi:Cdc6-like AAA superfamily ATPase